MERRTRASSLSWVFLALAFAGTIIPLATVLPWLEVFGVDVARFVGELFSNRVSAFFAWDVVISALVVLIAAWWVPGITRGQRLIVSGGTLLVGVSCGLPLLLCFWLRHGVVYVGEARDEVHWARAAY